MKLVAVHDTTGNILRLHTLPHNAPMPLINNTDECHITELDTTEINLDFAQPAIHYHLHTIVKEYLVERFTSHAYTGRLVRKQV